MALKAKLGQDPSSFFSSQNHALRPLLLWIAPHPFKGALDPVVPFHHSAPAFFSSDSLETEPSWNFRLCVGPSFPLLLSSSWSPPYCVSFSLLCSALNLLHAAGTLSPCTGAQHSAWQSRPSGKPTRGTGWRHWTLDSTRKVSPVVSKLKAQKFGAIALFLQTAIVTVLCGAARVTRTPY